MMLHALRVSLAIEAQNKITQKTWAHESRKIIDKAKRETTKYKLTKEL